MKLKSFLQKTFDMSARVCSKLDADIAKNIVRGKKSWEGIHEGSLSKRAKSYYWVSASWKLAAGEKIAKAPFAALRGVSERLLK